MIWVALGAYVLCGGLAYGITFGFFVHKYPSVIYQVLLEHRAIAAITAALGPLGLIWAIVTARRDTFRMRWRSDGSELIRLVPSYHHGMCQVRSFPTAKKQQHRRQRTA